MWTGSQTLRAWASEQNAVSFKHSSRNRPLNTPRTRSGSACRAGWNASRCRAPVTNAGSPSTFPAPNLVRANRRTQRLGLRSWEASSCHLEVGRDWLGRPKYYYFRRRGRRWQLPRDPTSGEFAAEYQRLLKETEPGTKTEAPADRRSYAAQHVRGAHQRLSRNR